nr:uncharacterized protein LOC105463775 isoform X2 [Macaca nemestrina]
MHVEVLGPVPGTCAGLRLACSSGENEDSICKLDSQKQWILAPEKQCQGDDHMLLESTSMPLTSSRASQSQFPRPPQADPEGGQNWTDVHCLNETVTYSYDGDGGDGDDDGAGGVPKPTTTLRLYGACE